MGQPHQLPDGRGIGQCVAHRPQGAQRVTIATSRERVGRGEELLVVERTAPASEAQNLGLDVGRPLAPAPDGVGAAEGGPAGTLPAARLRWAPLADDPQG